MNDKLDLLTNELEQVFSQSGGWKECRHILGKFMVPTGPTCDEVCRVADDSMAYGMGSGQRGTVITIIRGAFAKVEDALAAKGGE